MEICKTAKRNNFFSFVKQLETLFSYFRIFQFRKTSETRRISNLFRTVLQFAKLKKNTKLSTLLTAIICKHSPYTSSLYKDGHKSSCHPKHIKVGWDKSAKSKAYTTRLREQSYPVTTLQDTQYINCRVGQRERERERAVLSRDNPTGHTVNEL